MKNKIELTFGEKTFTAKFGLQFLQNVTTGEGITSEKLFTDFSNAVKKDGEEDKVNMDFFLFMIPKLVYYSINTANPDSVTLEDVFELIEEEGIVSDVIMLFVSEFGASFSVMFPDKVGKQKPKPKAKGK